MHHSCQSLLGQAHLSDAIETGGRAGGGSSWQSEVDVPTQNHESHSYEKPYGTYDKLQLVPHRYSGRPFQSDGLTHKR